MLRSDNSKPLSSLINDSELDEVGQVEEEVFVESHADNVCGVRVDEEVWRQLYKDRSSRKTGSLEEKRSLGIGVGRIVPF